MQSFSDFSSLGSQNALTQKESLQQLQTDVSLDSHLYPKHSEMICLQSPSCTERPFFYLSSTSQSPTVSEKTISLKFQHLFYINHNTLEMLPRKLHKTNLDLSRIISSVQDGKRCPNSQLFTQFSYALWIICQAFGTMTKIKKLILGKYSLPSP